MHRDSSICLCYTPETLPFQWPAVAVCLCSLPARASLAGATTLQSLHKARAPALQSCRSQHRALSTSLLALCITNNRLQQPQSQCTGNPSLHIATDALHGSTTCYSLFMLCLHTKKHNQALVLVGILFCWITQWILWKGVTISTTVDCIRISQ